MHKIISLLLFTFVVFLTGCNQQSTSDPAPNENTGQVLSENLVQDTPTIFLNGQQLTPEEINQFERLVNQHVASGGYWLDADSGLWGYGDYPDNTNQTANVSLENKRTFEDKAAEFGFSPPPVQY